MYSLQFGYIEWNVFPFHSNLKYQLVKKVIEPQLKYCFNTALSDPIRFLTKLLLSIGSFFGYWHGKSVPIHTIISKVICFVHLEHKLHEFSKNCRAAKNFNSFRFSTNKYRNICSSMFEFRENLSRCLYPSSANLSQTVSIALNKH